MSKNPRGKNLSRRALLGAGGAGALLGFGTSEILKGNKEDSALEGKRLAHFLRDMVQSRQVAYVADALRLIQKNGAINPVMNEFSLWENDDETAKKREMTEAKAFGFLQENNIRSVARQFTEAVSNGDLVDVISIMRASLENDIFKEMPAGKSLNAMLKNLPSREQSRSP